MAGRRGVEAPGAYARQRLPMPLYCIWPLVTVLRPGRCRVHVVVQCDRIVRQFIATPSHMLVGPREQQYAEILRFAVTGRFDAHHCLPHARSGPYLRARIRLSLAPAPRGLSA
jgi:hypothetical protein